MAKELPFGAHATADQVLAGIDLTGKHFVVTGCSSGLGLETMGALAANGARVIGLARTLASAKDACAEVGALATPLACDLADFESIGAAAAAIRSLKVSLDAIVSNAGVAYLPALQTRYGVERQFLVNHIGHFYLLNELLDSVRDGTGRIVIVSSSVGVHRAPAQGIMFDNLDGHFFYKPTLFYAQSKFANALHAKELSRRLHGRGIAVNSLHPGAARGTQVNRNRSLTLKAALAAGRVFLRSAAHGAATQAMLAASPRVAGISGEYWRNCRIAPGNPLLNNVALARQLWEISADVVSRHTVPSPKQMLAAA